MRIASLAGRDRAVEALRYVAPVGEPDFVEHALAVIEPYLAATGDPAGSFADPEVAGRT